MWARRSVAVVGLLLIIGYLMWRSSQRGALPASPPNGSGDDAPAAATPATEPAAGPAPGLAGRDAPAPVVPPAAVITGPKITGRVVDATGKAVAGARVVATSDMNAKTFDVRAAGGDGAPATAATTDDAGRFALAAAKNAPRHFLIATADGQGVATRNDVAPGADVVLALPAAVTLVGTVKDRAGAPVVGAKVRVLLLFETATEVRETRSGEGGAYRVAVPPMDDPYVWRGRFARAWIEVVAEGFAPLFLDAPATAGGAETRLDIVVSRGSTLAGRVIDDESETPVEGATLQLTSREGAQGFGRDNGVMFSSPFGPRVLSTAASGPDGAFRFERVPCEGPHAPVGIGGSRTGAPVLGSVVAWKAGFALQGANVEWLADGARQEVVLRLRPAGSVAGRVLEADGTPVVGANVSAAVEGFQVGTSVPLLPDDAPRAWGTAGADGRFALGGVPTTRAGATSARVEARRPIVAGPPRAGPESVARAEARVEFGSSADVGDLRFDPVAAVPTTTVLVLDSAGRPIWGASVGRAGAMWTARTDAAGRVAMPWTQVPGRELKSYEATVRAPGFAPTPVRLFPPGTGPEPLEVRLEPGGRVSGRVRRADGGAASNAMVSVGRGSLAVADVFPAPKAGGIAEYQADDFDPARAKVVGTATADRDGAFEAVDLPAGPYHLRASVPKRFGVGPAATSSAIVPNVASGTTDVEIVLPADDSPATGRLEGRVTSGMATERFETLHVTLRRGAEVLGGAFLVPRGSFAPSPNAARPTVHADGRFVFDVVPVGPLTIQVTAAGFRDATVESVEVREGETTTVPAIALDRGIAVVGRVRAPAGLTWKGRKLLFQPAGDGGGRAASVSVAEDGTYRATGLVPGTYSVTSPSQRWGEKDDPPLLPVGAGTVRVAEGAFEATWDGDFVAAGTISLAPMDARLPHAPWAGAEPTDAQTKFGAATRVRVTGPDGAKPLDHVGVHQGGVLAKDRSTNVGFLTLLPGRYVARIEFPGGEAREEVVTLEAGAMVNVFLQKR